jgi:pimeloyl-ACP methyl ester carboxylesterase
MKMQAVLLSGYGFMKSSGVRREFRVSNGELQLVADTWGDPSAPAVLLAHGGGQTRHAWGETARLLAEQGKYAVALDMRGHGESDWDKQSRYDFQHYAGDLSEIVQQLLSQGAGQKPAAVGASLGGISSLIAHHLNHQQLFSEIVLVDITPRVEMDGLGRIRDFMLEHAEKGFASLEEAADFVSSYTPNRKRSNNTDGLKKNLRLGDDGRYRWHWDPKFFAKRPDQKREGHVKFTLMEDAAKALTIPTLLVRGKVSDLVSPEGAKEFLDLVPHAEFIDIDEAGHMVAGDKNDIFSSAVINFLCRR